MWKNFIADYFSFTKKERTGIIVLLVLIIFFILVPFLFPLFIHRQPTTDAAFKKQVEALVIKQTDSAGKFPGNQYEGNRDRYYRENDNKKYHAGQTKGELFAFDPNTLEEAGWQRLGIRDKTIATIKNFVSKGGKFYKPEDIAKIWGLHEAEVKRLLPYVQIVTVPAKNPERKPYETKTYDRPKYTPAIIDINTADTTALIALPGIGSKLSQRIIFFRDKLGGFYKVEQVGETFGLRDSVFQLIKARFTVNAPVTLRQININTATLDEMKTHPYLRYAVANAIVQYRSQHGNYTAVTDIKKIMLVTEEVYNKAAPYLKTN